MARFEERFWEPAADALGLARRDRRGGRYQIYLPDPLVPRRFVFGGEEAADIADAERAIVLLDERSAALADTEALARLLLRAESVGSSHIEGLVIGARRLLRADAARELGEEQPDVTAAEVLGNIDAMTYAMGVTEEGCEIGLPLLLETHRRLFAGTPFAEHGGRIRDVQNWIGGSSYNPCSAAFVPPPAEMVEGFLIDLCAFSNEDALPAVAQAAIAHAQFETIHPFVDGNGRVGRALIHMILRRRRLTQHVSLPVSLVLATRAREYVEGLSATRYSGEYTGPAAVAGINQWVGTFAAACTRAAVDATAFERRVQTIQAKWRDAAGPLRSDAAALRLIDVLPGVPIIGASVASRMIGRSLTATMDGIEKLLGAGILRPLHAGRQRKQVFEARDVVEAFSAFERQLASPTGDTKREPPNRAVPARPPGSSST